MFQIEIPTFLASAAMPGDRRRMPQWWKKLVFIDKQTQMEQLGVPNQQATQTEQLGVQKATQDGAAGSHLLPAAGSSEGNSDG